MKTPHRILFGVLCCSLVATTALRAAPKGEEEETPDRREARERAQQEEAEARERTGWSHVVSSDVHAMRGLQAGGPLIVPLGEMKEETRKNIEEDSRIMNAILKKTASEVQGRERGEWASGIELSIFFDERKPQTIYLEGYGALFQFHVDFPLVAAREAEDKKADRPEDNTWEQTKRELYGPDGERIEVETVVGKWFAGSQSVRFMEYDAKRVERLKKGLLSALKNASNLRHLKPEESIIVAVSGSPSVAPGEDEWLPFRPGRGRGAGEEAPPRATLTIRVKKSDADTFAKDKISAEEFAKRASVVLQ